MSNPQREAGEILATVEVTDEELAFLKAFRTGKPSHAKGGAMPAPGTGRHFGQLLVEVGNALDGQGATEPYRDQVQRF